MSFRHCKEISNHTNNCDADYWRMQQLLLKEDLLKYSFLQLDINNKILSNMGAKKSPSPKIPPLLHGIWLTHPSSPKELSQNVLNNIIENKEIFKTSSLDWINVIWVNDRTLIPNSTNFLEQHNVEVRHIGDYKPYIALYDNIQNFIAQKAWGMASDTLRYAILKQFGGVYADLNYKFSRTIDNEIFRYDFFAPYLINNCFAAKANHPILQKLIEIADSNINSPPLYINAIEESDIYLKTIYISFLPFTVAFLQSANHGGNIDVVYPTHNNCGEYYNKHTGHYECSRMPPYSKVTWPDLSECNALVSLNSFNDGFDFCRELELNVGFDDNTGDCLTWLDT